MRGGPPKQLQLEATRSASSAALGSVERRVRHSNGKAQRPSGVRRPSAADLLETPGALLTRSHLRQLGLERRAIDAVFRSLPVVALPGYSRPMIRAEEYHQLVDAHTHRDDRVRPRHA